MTGKIKTKWVGFFPLFSFFFRCLDCCPVLSGSSKVRVGGLPSFSIRAATGTTLTHWCNAQSVHFIALLVWLYTFFISVHAITLIRIGYKQITRCSRAPYSLMVGNYALTPIATDCLHVLEHILFLLTHILCSIRTFSIVIPSCPFQQPVQLC